MQREQHGDTCDGGEGKHHNAGPSVHSLSHFPPRQNGLPRPAGCFLPWQICLQASRVVSFYYQAVALWFRGSRDSVLLFHFSAPGMTERVGSLIRGAAGDAVNQHYLVFLFDGTCGVCTRFAHWVKLRDTAERVLVLPNQRPGLIEQFGLTREEVDRSAWTIEPSGRQFEGAASINRVLDEFEGGWQMLAMLYWLAGPVRRVEDLGYRWIADHRSWLAPWGVTPECERPGVECT